MKAVDELLAEVWPEDCIKWQRWGPGEPPSRHYCSPNGFEIEELLSVVYAKANLRHDLTMPLLRQILRETLRADVDTLKAELVAIALTR